MKKIIFLASFLLGIASTDNRIIAQAVPGKSLTDKTLVVWVKPAQTDLQGGSALTIDDGFSHFDAIVFGERVKGSWMAGSDGFQRSGLIANSCPAPEGSAADFQQLAVVYRGKTVTILMDGKPCNSFDIRQQQIFTANSTILFGRRHLDMQGDGYFQGAITDARIYDRALTAEEIAALVPDRITGTEPWAWWPFTSGSLQDRMGKFTKITLSGEVGTENGCLVLGGKNATMTLTPSAEEMKATGSKVLADNLPIPKKVLQSTREFRERLMADPYRPAYHFCIPEDNGMPGDPNGAFWYQGRYHLMYLYNREGSGFCWGHISSSDLVHWRNHPDAIGPGNGDDGCFSGGAYVTPEGKAYLTYWMLWGDKGIGMAESKGPGFDTWTKTPENPVIKSTEWGITERNGKNNENVKNGKNGENGKNEEIFGSADPSNIWMKDGKYYMLTGNLLVLNKYGRQADAPADMQGDRVYLFRSDDLKKWDYMHPFYESKREWTAQSEDNMCPSFLPLPSAPDGGAFSGKHLMLFISHNKGCQYYTGDYKNDHFYPETHGRMTWIDNGYFAPEALVDGNGRQVMWAWVFDDRPDSLKNYSGWTGTYGLPRSLWLGDDGTLRMQPVKELKTLRMNEKSKSDFTIKAGSKLDLDNFGSELMELEIVMDAGAAAKVTVAVCRSADGREETAFSYVALKNQLTCDASRSSLKYGRRVTETAPFTLKKDEPLTLRIFVDRSIVEVYANDRQAIARAVYPTLGGKGIRFYATGGDVKVKSFKAWEMMPANGY